MSLSFANSVQCRYRRIFFYLFVFMSFITPFVGYLTWAGKIVARMPVLNNNEIAMQLAFDPEALVKVEGVQKSIKEGKVVARRREFPSSVSDSCTQRILYLGWRLVFYALVGEDGKREEIVIGERDNTAPQDFFRSFPMFSGYVPPDDSEFAALLNAQRKFAIRLGNRESGLSQIFP